MKIMYENQIFDIKEKLSVEEIFKDIIKNSEILIVGAIVNNEYQSLNYIIEEDSTIELLGVNTIEGKRIYVRTLLYLMEMAFERIYPDVKLVTRYRLQDAIYCNAEKQKITFEMINKIEKEMIKLVEENKIIEQVVLSRQDAEKIYLEHNSAKGRLQLDIKNNSKIIMYYCDGYYNYLYGVLANRTGVMNYFKLDKYGDGILLKYPESYKTKRIKERIKEKKLAWALSEYEEIHDILEINSLHKLNKAIQDNDTKNIIMLDEAYHEREIAKIAEKINKNRKIKMVLIAGPSSSGKTTFAQRLGIQLKLNKLKPRTISVDNYFVEREVNPLDENGEYDFETIKAVDLKLFNNHLTKLLNGEEIEMPQFNFLTGHKEYNGHKMKLEDDEILVIEGIHCLNDELTSEIPKDRKFKIYISALTVINFDRYNRLSTTDMRLIRRIARDYQFRGYSAEHTIKNWWKVKKGERLYILPFQEEADEIFNTSLIYEMGVLKPIVMPLLEDIPKNKKEYAEAQRLINILRYFKSVPKKYVPSNSLLKEFTGGGNFEY